MFNIPKKMRPMLTTIVMILALSPAARAGDLDSFVQFIEMVNQMATKSAGYDVVERTACTYKFENGGCLRTHGHDKAKALNVVMKEAGVSDEVCKEVTVHFLERYLEAYRVLSVAADIGGK